MITCADLSWALYPAFALSVLAGLGVVFFGIAAVIRAENGKSQ